MRRLFRLTLIGAMFVALALGTWLWHFAQMPLRLSDTPHAFSVKPGSTIRTVSRQLVDEGVLSEPWSFFLMARISGRAEELKAGNYSIESEISPYRLFDRLTNGDTAQIGITFIEGWTFRQIRNELNRHEGLRHVSMSLSDAEILHRIGAKEIHPEGLFFPDTYYFSSDMSDLEILSRAYQVMQERLDQAWKSRDDGLPYKSPYEALIMASIVEKETGMVEERAQIARVFLNRMRISMRLQTDPTVIYGLGTRFDGNLRKQDLLNDTPYNTYTRSGLPPTPIAMPGMGAIEAALNPARNEGHLYFVGRGDGGHVFSKTLADHNRAVARYQRGRK